LIPGVSEHVATVGSQILGLDVAHSLELTDDIVDRPVDGTIKVRLEFEERAPNSIGHDLVDQEQ